MIGYISDFLPYLKRNPQSSLSIENELDSFLDSSDQESLLDPGINESNLFVSILTKPSATIRFLLHLGTEKYVLPIFLLAGIRNALDQVMEKVDFSAGSNYQIGYLIGGTIGGALIGVVLYYLYASLMAVFGKWVFNGTGNSSQFRVVSAWATIPALLGSVLLIPQYWVMKVDPSFQNEYVGIGILGVLGLAQLTLGIWTLVIMMKGAMIVQGFNAWKSFFNVLLPGVTLIIIVVLIALTFSLNS